VRRRPAGIDGHWRLEAAWCQDVPLRNHEEGWGTSTMIDWLVSWVSDSVSIVVAAALMEFVRTRYKSQLAEVTWRGAFVAMLVGAAIAVMARDFADYLPAGSLGAEITEGVAAIALLSALVLTGSAATRSWRLRRDLR